MAKNKRARSTAKGGVQPFSRRHGLRPAHPPISIWDDAPENFRFAILQIANEDCKLGPSALRDIVCKVLRKRPNLNNFTPFPNIWNEVQSLFDRCEWFRVYDIIEAIWGSLGRRSGASVHGTIQSPKSLFENEINELMADFGIGWQLDDGCVQSRGENTYEAILKDAKHSLEDEEMTTALSELEEASLDLSRRPFPDTSGAIQHSMAALECVVREITGDSKPTLGKLIKKYPDIFPKPIDEAAEKLWGFASEKARHVREGEEQTREESMFIVGIAATMVNYLILKAKEE